MTIGSAYAIGTILRLLGIILLIRGLTQATPVVMNVYGLDRPRAIRSLTFNFAFGAVAFLIAGPLLVAASGNKPWFVPLFWLIMPFPGWLCLASALGILTRLSQAIVFRGKPEAAQAYRALAVWALFFLVGGFYFKDEFKDSVQIVSGGLQLAPETAIGLLLLGFVAMVAMTATQRTVRSRGFSKMVVTQAVLLIGSIVFGLPFLWLVITSFKMDQDMASPNGIVWVPKVDVTREYLDPTDPLLQFKYQGVTVEGSIITKHANGMLTLSITEPYSMEGHTVVVPAASTKNVPKNVPIVTAPYKGQKIQGMLTTNLPTGEDIVKILKPANLAGTSFQILDSDVVHVRKDGLYWRNYPESLSYLPAQAHMGLTYLKNTVYLVILSIIGTILSSSLVAYAFSRMRFPAKNLLFTIVLSTMMLPGAVTLLPQFLVFKDLGWIDTLRPLWVPAFFASAFNVFLLRQFFLQIPMELEDAAKIDGCSYLKTFWSVMIPQVKPALAVIAIWTFMGAWNNFMGPLIYVSTPSQMVIAYAVQLFNGDHGGEPGLLMAFASMSMVPVIALFFFAQRYFIEGVTLSGLGGR